MTPVAKTLHQYLYLPSWAVIPVLSLLYLFALLVILLFLGSDVQDIPYMDAGAVPEAPVK